MPSPATSTRPGWDRHWWLITLLAACVVIPRAAMICRAHNEGVDDDYHLRRGLMFWTRPDVSLPMSNPPLGGAITALPMVLLGCDSRSPINPATVPPAELSPPALRAGGEDPATPEVRRARARAARVGALYGQRLPPHALLMIIGLWKAALYVPLVTLAFSWCRELYGLASGWMAGLLLMFEPNLAAYIHSPSLDVLGIEAVAIACYVGWRYARTPTTGWLIATAVVAAFAMLVKHLAVIVPGVLVLYLLVEAIARGRPMRGPGVWRTRVRRVALAVLVWGVSLWALTGFDVSVPADVGGGSPWATDSGAAWKQTIARVVDARLTMPMPAGQYVGSTFHLLRYNAHGYWSYLFGEHRQRGWWYYYPAVATYKVPLGVGLIFLAALTSVRRVKPRAGELALLVPLVAWGVLVLRAQMNVGLRHALPAYAFALLLASRAVAPGAPRWLRATTWAGVAAAALHGLSYHPNYHAYLNLPRTRAYLDISDSNVDWGQTVRTIGPWLDAHAAEVGGRPVFVRPFGDDLGLAQGWYLRGRTTHVRFGADPPTTGLLIISPIHLVGLFDPERRYTVLASITPDAIIADTMLVYDLDKLMAGGFAWPPPARSGLPFTDVR